MRGAYSSYKSAGGNPFDLVVAVIYLAIVPRLAIENKHQEKHGSTMSRVDGGDDFNSPKRKMHRFTRPRRGLH